MDTGLKQTITGTVAIFVALLLASCDPAVSHNTAPSLALDFYLQQGHLGYTGNTDTSIYKVPVGFNPNPGTFGQLYIQTQADGTTGRYVFMRFDLEPVKQMILEDMTRLGFDYEIVDTASQLVVNDAELLLYGTLDGVAGTSPDMAVEPMKLTAPLFDQVSATWVMANSTEAWHVTDQGGGVISFDDVSTGDLDTVAIPGSLARWFTFHPKREFVQNWLNDPATNKGVRLSIAGGGTATGMYFFSSEFVAADMRPMLHLNIQVLPPP